MFLSILPDLQDAATKITCQIDDRLIRIFSNSFPKIEFVPKQRIFSTQFLRDHVIIRMGSLPFIFRRSVGDFNGLPYLKPTDESVSKFNSLIKNLHNRPTTKVAISWKGGTSLSRAKERSMELENFLKIFESKTDLDLYCIQHGNIESELNAVQEKHNLSINIFPSDS